MSGYNFATNNPLPDDEELVHRENLFLNLFQKYSVDEGSDAELGDISLSDEDAEDENESSSSYSEASSVKSGSDTSSVIEKIKQDIQPVVKDRIDAWPQKGVHLQLKTVDPSVSVDDWLKANREFTTTTKKFKKTVVNEEGRRITTTTKQMKTTTKKSSFQSSIPRFIRNDQQNALEGNVVSNNDSMFHPKSKRPDNTEKGAKLTQQMKPKKVKNAKPKELPSKTEIPESVAYSLRQRNGPLVTNKKVADNVEQSTMPKRDNKKQSNTILLVKQERNEPEVTAEKKISNSTVAPLDDGSKRSLRSRLKENSVKRVEDEKCIKKQSKLPVQKKCNKQGNLKEIDLYTNSAVAVEQNTKRPHRSRSPLKEKMMNPVSSQIVRPDKIQMKNVTVDIKRLPCRKVNTRESVRIQKIVAESTKSSFHEPIIDSLCVSNYDETIDRSNAGVWESRINQSLTRTSMIKYEPPKRQITIHSPNSKRMLGTKIDDTFMRVTKRDYEKRIGPRDLRITNESILNNSIVPMNRRIVYQPPTVGTIIEISSDSGSEGEDMLVTTYTKTGHIFQTNA